jgi:methionyl-tRNA formyltransferase
MGVKAIIKSIVLIKEGKAPRIPQDESRATYEPPCNDRVAGIDWGKSAKEVHNLVRGCDPQPGAHTLVKGERVRFYGARLIGEPTDKEPGTVFQIDDQGVHVAVSGERLIISKAKTGQGQKVPAADFAAERGIRVGNKLGNPSSTKEP